VLNNSLLRLVDVLVLGNTAAARGRHTLAQGGGIWNGPLLSGPPVRLELRDVRVRDNAVSSSNGPREGGGIYTTVPIAVRGLVLAHNRPDDCSGC
jgi:hypothetical protein